MVTRPRAIVVVCATLLASLASAVDSEVASQADVRGTWEIHVDTDASTGDPVFKFKQDGDKLTGQYNGMFGELPVTGTVEGNEITFSIVMDAAGEDQTIVYKGSVLENTITGSIDLGAYGSGTFEGKRSLSAVVTPEIWAEAAKQAEQLIQLLDVRRDVKFAKTPEKDLLLDVYSPRGARDKLLPCVV